MSSSTKTVLITGCSAGGIGHALAREFHSQGTWTARVYIILCKNLRGSLYNFHQGLRVFATSRTMESMADLASTGIETMVFDVTDLTSVRQVRDRIAMLTGGKLDILVNNACVLQPSHRAHYSPSMISCGFMIQWTR